MNHTLRVLAVAGFLSLSGCTVYGSGQVAFLWTFNGGQACETAGVNLVQVQIAGFVTTVTCRDYYGVPGLTTPFIPSGTQVYTVTGLSPTYDANGVYTGTTVPRYQTTNTVNVLSGGLVQLLVDLAPINPPAGSNITFLWTFGGKTCAQAAVANINVQVTDPAAPVNMTVPCTQGGIDGATVQMFTKGTYPFTLTALDVAATPIYSAAGSVTVDGYNSVVLNVDMGPVGATGVGTLMILWTFGGQSCTAAGVANIHFSLRDNLGAIVSGTDMTDTCASIGPGISIGSLTSGNYWLEAQGQNSGGQVTYVLNPYQVYVSPGATSTYTPNLMPK
jgi:hypothetical protein